MELDNYTLYGIIEGLMVLIGIAVFFYFRIKKYKPYYEHNTSPKDFHKKYLQQSIGFTRNHARSLNKAAESGDKDAIKQQKYLVARLNWLTLERDFITESKPDTSYWKNLNKKIKSLLERWDLVKFIDEQPDEKAVATAINQDSSGELPDDEDIDLEKELIELGGDDLSKKEIEALKKKLRNLASYKNLYFSQQNAYREMVDSYKELKTALNTLELEAENASKLREMLASHEQNEGVLEQQIKDMEAQQERLNAELDQLEAVFNAQLEETEQVEETQPPEAPADTDNEEEIHSVQEIIDHQNSAVRTLKAKVLGMNTDPETRLQLEEQIDEIEKGNQELQTCVQMLELERDRLSSELKSLQG